MKKEITLGQLLSVSVTLLIALITGWITLNNKVTRQETEMQELKETQYNLQLKLDKTADRIEEKTDKISDDIRNILIQLQDKQNRK